MSIRYDSKYNLPTYDSLIFPIINIVKKLKGSASRAEIFTNILDELNLSQDQLENTYNNGIYIIDSRVDFALSYLKMGGYVEKSQRGILSLTEQGYKVNKKEDLKEFWKEIQKKARKTHKEKNLTDKKNNKNSSVEAEQDHKVAEENSWKVDLPDILKAIHPKKFEDFCVLVIKNLGIKVEGTPYVKDGGIDGKGLIKINEVVSFPIIFQFKRYTGRVPVSDIRELQGKIGKNDVKGIFITTGKFTGDAIKEATNQGNIRIDLINGDTLCDLLLKLELGVTLKPREVVNKEFFNKWINYKG